MVAFYPLQVEYKCTARVWRELEIQLHVPNTALIRSPKEVTKSMTKGKQLLFMDIDFHADVY
ncbi:hypothetical protein PR729_26050 [Providencia rettgeri]|nr:hypothetical protein PR729_26050 [Providencia rettgeri]